MTERAPFDPQKAVQRIWDCAPAYAKAKGERVYLEEFRKSKKALLMRQAEIDGIKTVAQQEAFAYSHAEYIELLEGLKASVQTEELARWQMVTAQAAVEVWRSQEASARAEGRATQ